MTKHAESQANADYLVLVLGMHKSGTTLIAETLHRSGIAMIGQEKSGGYDDGNKMERAETRALNMEFLGDDGVESLRLIHPLSADAVTDAKLERARAFVDGMEKASWGFKDPRTLLTFDVWQQVLDAPILVGVFRDPVEVFGHYLSRAGRRWINRDPTYLPDALRSWCIYNRLLLDLKRRHPNMLLLDYDMFMTTDSGMQRLAAHLGRDLVDCRKPGMRRAQAMVTADYRLARLLVRLRDGLKPDRIHSDLLKAASQ